jgi:hypothetical protein
MGSSIYIYMYVCMYVCMYVYIYNLFLYIICGEFSLYGEFFFPKKIMSNIAIYFFPKLNFF